jgi:hypothetical protein
MIRSSALLQRSSSGGCSSRRFTTISGVLRTANIVGPESSRRSLVIPSSVTPAPGTVHPSDEGSSVPQLTTSAAARTLVSASRMRGTSRRFSEDPAPRPRGPRRPKRQSVRRGRHVRVPAAGGELTQTCHVRPRRPHLPWPRRVRCRRSPSTHCVSRRRGDGNGAPLVQARGLRGLAVTARETRPSSPGTGLSRSLLRVDYWPDLARVFSLPASGSASMEAFRDQSRLRAARLEHLVASPPTAAPTAHAHVRGFFASGEEQMAKQLRRTPWNGFLGIHGCGKPGSQDVS